MWLGVLVGGAAGYCPRVRQVTYRSSTYIVPLAIFTIRLHSKAEQTCGTYRSQKIEARCAETPHLTEPASMTHHSLADMRSGTEAKN